MDSSKKKTVVALAIGSLFLVIYLLATVFYNSLNPHNINAQRAENVFDAYGFEHINVNDFVENKFYYTNTREEMYADYPGRVGGKPSEAILWSSRTLAYINTNNYMNVYYYYTQPIVETEFYRFTSKFDEFGDGVAKQKTENYVIERDFFEGDDVYDVYILSDLCLIECKYTINNAPMFYMMLMDLGLPIDDVLSAAFL